jgi:hypothetical protein
MSSLRSTALALVAVFALVAATPSNGPASMEASFHQQLFVLKALKPDIKKVGLFVDAAFAQDASQMDAVTRAAAGSQVKIHLATITSVADVASKFRALESDGIDAVWVPESTGNMGQSAARTFLVENAARKRMPLFGPNRSWVDAGALGAFEGGLVINQRTLNALSLAVPASIAGSAQMLAAN